MVRVRLFIEGGGSGELPDKEFRQAWKKFFESAGLIGRLPKAVRGESRNETFDKFGAALRKRNADELALLLVDSEGPVTAGHSAWQHLRNRDNWDQPPDAANDSAYLMVQVMETWFLADRDALRRFFGPSLNENYFREWQNLETVPKDTVYNALERATRDCQKQYRKGRISFLLLCEISPERVAEFCPHARILLDYLRGL